uniref:5-hydroxytryptamine receptor 3A-like n=1 Tax=Solea senegalensis TaxID=28829 RepID=UPI001CD91705|nr:5-hydroxytryptamine receptor 3A-like [Solea senegalensis]
MGGSNLPIPFVVWVSIYRQHSEDRGEHFHISDFGLFLILNELVMFVSLFFVFLFTDGASSEGKCAYQDLIKHLGLTYDNKTFHMTRPVADYSEPTRVIMELTVSAILEVQFLTESFFSSLCLNMLVSPCFSLKMWENDFVRWNETEFCDNRYLIVPAELMWKPHLSILELTESDKSKPNPYVIIRSYGDVTLMDELVLVSTCKMQVYRFPFDTQSCKLTFRSVVHSDEEIKFLLTPYERITEKSRRMTQNQSEWELISITSVIKTEETFIRFNQSLLIYTIKIKRRSALYIVNFILPILFFLCLDLASFLISDTSGEKLGFKVTVLLAVTVMQLILNEILPSSSERIPLIAVYCIGVFALMMLSLLESVFVMYLIEKDNAPQDNETDEDLRLSEDKRGKARCEGEVNKCVHSSSGCDVSPIKTPSEKLPVATEDSNIQLMEVSLTLYEVRNQIKTLLVSSRKEEAKPGYWTKVARRINKVFIICYVSAIIVFLAYIFSIWTVDND